ncbi:hypothetical protein DFH06DRAFT_1441665 [Mycena polygramma]|nr:hypothetical protein DFH06DRAFT_1441665 [Mycena polygramma]
MAINGGGDPLEQGTRMMIQDTTNCYSNEAKPHAQPPLAASAAYHSEALQPLAGLLNVALEQDYLARHSRHSLDSQLNFNDVDDEPDAASTIGATSSPQGPDIPELYNLPHVPFLDLGSDDLADQDSDLTYGSNAQAAEATDTDRTLAVLEFMKENFPRFSLRALITELFTSDDGSVKNVANNHLAMGGSVHLLEVAIGDKGMVDSKIADWIMDQAMDICSRDSWLTDNTSRGDHFEDEKSLHIPAKSRKIELLQSFSPPGLLSLYERTMPRLQKLLKAVTGKDSPLSASESVVRSRRNPNMVSILNIYIPRI